MRNNSSCCSKALPRPIAVGKFIKERLNHRPLKCLDFQTPTMVFSQLDPGAFDT